MKYGNHFTFVKNNMIGLCIIFIVGMMLSIAISAPTPIAALPDQDSVCSLQVQTALQQVARACTNLGRNEACYGSDFIVVEPRPNIPLDQFTFSSAGDIANLRLFQRISTSPYDQTLSHWGIALLKAQVNLPDSLPGQNVTFLLFGDTTVSSETPEMRAITVRIRIGAVLCEDVPESALLIQSPNGGSIELMINGAEVRLGSTARITTTENGIMRVGLLEGTGVVSALGTVRDLTPGMETEMTLGGEDGYTVITPPSELHSFSLTSVNQLPLTVLEQRDWAGIENPSAEAINVTTDCPTPSTYSHVYVIRPGDTLSWIAIQAGVTINELIAANCIVDARYIIAGQRIAVPIEIVPPVLISSPISGDGSSGSNNSSRSGATCGNGICERESGENPGQCRADCPPGHGRGHGDDDDDDDHDHGHDDD